MAAPMVGLSHVIAFRRLTLGLLVLSCWLSGCTADREAPADVAAESDEDELINGKIAADGDFRPTLLIENSCTAVKVGPRRILTAAHCVDGRGGRVLQAGQKLMFHTENAVTDKTVLSLAKYAEIESVRMHPSYVSGADLADAPDVAVIVVRGASLDDVPSALVDLDPVALSSKLIIAGYGCRQVMMGGGTGDHTLTFATAKTVPASSIGLPYVTERLQLIDQNFVVTPGPATVDGAAGVCPGDSGGPVFRTGTTKLTVAAISSFTAGATRDGPRGNFLARLHEGSRHSVGEWLSQQGVRLSRPCKDAKRCAAVVKKPD